MSARACASLSSMRHSELAARVVAHRGEAHGRIAPLPTGIEVG
jgi:hypothetical protein